MEQNENKENVKAAIGNVLNSLFLQARELKEDNIFMSVLSDKNFQEQLNHLNPKHMGSIKDFMFIYKYNFDNFTENFIENHICNNQDFSFILQNMNFVENHFESIIVSKEGFACSADKSSFIINSLLKHFMTGEEIIINYDQEYTYHLPKKVFITHNDIIDFYKAVQFLYYGKSEKFLLQLKKIMCE